MGLNRKWTDLEEKVLSDFLRSYVEKIGRFAPLRHLYAMSSSQRGAERCNGLIRYGQRGGKSEEMRRLNFILEELNSQPPPPGFNYTHYLETIEDRERELIKRDPRAITLGESIYTEGDIEL